MVLSVRHPNDVIHIQETPSGVYLKRQLNQFLPEAFQIKTSKSCKFHLRIVNRSALILVVLVRRSSQKQIVLVRKPKRGLKTGRIDSPRPPPGKPYPTSTKMRGTSNTSTMKMPGHLSLPGAADNCSDSPPLRTRTLRPHPDETREAYRTSACACALTR